MRVPTAMTVAPGRTSTLDTHIDTVHLKRRDHACPYCTGIAYQTKSRLETHIETVHEKRRDHACPTPTAPASPPGR